MAATNDEAKKPRRLFVLRHAERVDITFGQQWLQLSFDADGKGLQVGLDWLVCQGGYASQMAIL